MQVIPHLADAIQDWIERVSKISVDDTKNELDACVIELDGTVDDIENEIFLESMSQLRQRTGKNNFLHIHVSPVLVWEEEQKTKPTQQIIRDVRRAELSFDLVRFFCNRWSSLLTVKQIVCRYEKPLQTDTIDKISQFCQVRRNRVIEVHNVPSTYHVPLLLQSQGLVPLLRDMSLFQLGK